MFDFLFIQDARLNRVVCRDSERSVLSRVGLCFLGELMSPIALSGVVANEFDGGFGECYCRTQGEPSRLLCAGELIEHRAVNVFPVRADADIEDLMNAATSQNFVPVIDDGGAFIGIITRKELMQFLVKKVKESEKSKKGTGSVEVRAFQYSEPV